LSTSWLPVLLLLRMLLLLLFLPDDMLQSFVSW